MSYLDSILLSFYNKSTLLQIKKIIAAKFIDWLPYLVIPLESSWPLVLGIKAFLNGLFLSLCELLAGCGWGFKGAGAVREQGLCQFASSLRDKCGGDEICKRCYAPRRLGPYIRIYMWMKG